MARAFPANNPGNPPTPFRRFSAGAIVFYLVALLEALTGTPRPSGQLIVETETETDSCGRLQAPSRNGRRYRCKMAPGHNGACGFTRRTVTETVTERAMRRRPGQRAVQVAKRTYSYTKFRTNAKKDAASASAWTDRQGNTLRIWGHLVLLEQAEALGFTVPGGRTIARPGNMGQAFENGAQATVTRGRVAPVDNTQAPAPTQALAGFAGIQAEAAARVVPNWVGTMSQTPEATAAREAAIAAREAARVGNAQAAAREAYAAREAAQAAASSRYRVVDMSSAPKGGPVREDTGTDPTIERFRRLQLS